MIADGHRVLIEKTKTQAKGSFYHDDAYLAVGAQIILDPRDVFGKLKVILKSKEPQFNQRL